MSYPIPDEALDDRLAFVGTSGSGKTYAAGTAVERLLHSKARTVIVDPLGVWWGLRLRADGETPSKFPVVIFGGEHGDLPINEHAGALIGETVAGMAESCIVALDGLGTKAAERRFMLAFLEKLYRKATGEPFHIIFDEADLWAPQKSSEPMLQNLMEQIVRRGRVKGFIPWLISQRPAVLSKDVLSQADGLIAMKLTASQDRDALGAWIEGQADRAEEKRILARLPQVERGSGVIWIPGRGVLTEAAFPLKATFDSSRTPKRGEKRQTRELKPIDLGALKVRLAKVEEESKANDPRALKAEVARLTRELTKAATNIPQNIPVADPKAVERARQEGFDAGATEGGDRVMRAVASLAGDLAESIGRAETACADAKRLLDSFSGFIGSQAEEIRKRPPPKTRPLAPPPVKRHTPAAHTNGALSGPQMKVVEALAFWSALGFDRPTRVQVGVVAGYSPTSGGFANLLGKLRTADVIDYPVAGAVSLTDHGRSIAPEPDSGSVQERALAILSGPQRKVLSVLLDRANEVSRDELGELTDYSSTSGGFANLLGSLRSLGLIDYPSKGMVRAEDWLFQ